MPVFHWVKKNLVFLLQFDFINLIMFNVFDLCRYFIYIGIVGNLGISKITVAAPGIWLAFLVLLVFENTSHGEIKFTPAE